MKFARIDPAAKALMRKNPSDAGADVYALTAITIPPFSAGVVRTGLTMEIPEGYCLQVWPKSGSDYLLGAGIIDAGYQGEVMIKMVNYKPEPLIILQGQAIAQLVLVRLGDAAVGTLEELPLTDIHRQRSARGAAGGINRPVSEA